MTLSLSAEDSLLLLTCRPYLDEEDQQRIRRLVARPLDWEHVLWRSEIFRTTPLVRDHLDRLGLLNSLPEQVVWYLDRWSALSKRRTQCLYGELGPILDAFESAGIDYFVLKGAAISPLLYPDPLTRPMLDLDLMIRPEAIPDAEALMEELGYEHGLWNPETNEITPVDYGPTDPEEHHELPTLLKLTHTTDPEPGAPIPRPWRWKHIKCFVGRGDVLSFPVFVDLHFNLSVGLDVEDVWRNARRESLLGRISSVQSPTGMLWFMAARLYNEAFQFGSLKLIMFGDAHTVLHTRGAEIEWGEVIGVAEKYGMHPSLFYVLSQLARLTREPIPDWVLKALEPDASGLPLLNDWGDVMPKLFSRPVVQDVVLA